MRFGSTAGSLKARSQLSRDLAKAFVKLGFYRYGLQAILILTLEQWSVLQIIGILLLNFIWVAILIKL